MACSHLSDVAGEREGGDVMMSPAFLSSMSEFLFSETSFSAHFVCLVCLCIVEIHQHTTGIKTMLYFLLKKKRNLLD